MQLIRILDCALANLTDPSPLSIRMARGQIDQYLRCKAKGHADTDDINQLIDQDPRPVLEYKDLINGEIYTTDYPDQGLYTFKEGYNLWISHNYKEIHTKTPGDFTPSNGFTTFRRATPDEIKMLDNTFTTDALE